MWLPGEASRRRAPGRPLLMGPWRVSDSGASLGEVRADVTSTLFQLFPQRRVNHPPGEAGGGLPVTLGARPPTLQEIVHQQMTHQLWSM